MRIDPTRRLLRRGGAPAQFSRGVARGRADAGGARDSASRSSKRRSDAAVSPHDAAGDAERGGAGAARARAAGAGGRGRVPARRARRDRSAAAGSGAGNASRAWHVVDRSDAAAAAPPPSAAHDPPLLRLGQRSADPRPHRRGALRGRLDAHRRSEAGRRPPAPRGLRLRRPAGAAAADAAAPSRRRRRATRCSTNGRRCRCTPTGATPRRARSPRRSAASSTWGRPPPSAPPCWRATASPCCRSTSSAPISPPAA